MTVSTRTPETVSVTRQPDMQTVSVNGTGDVIIRTDADSIMTVRQVGNDLVLGLANGEMIRIEGYFANQDGIDVFFVDDDGIVSSLVEVRGGGDAPLLLQLGEVGAAADGGSGVLGILGAVGALGLAAAAGGGGGGGSGGDDGDADSDSDSDSDIEAVDDQATVTLEVTPTIITDFDAEALSGTAGSLLDLGLLGDTVDVALLSNSRAFSFDISTNTTQQLVINGGGSTLLDVSLGGDNDLDVFVFRQEEGSTNASLVFSETDWLQFSPFAEFLGIALGGSWTGANLSLPQLSGGATYHVVIGNDGGLLNLGAGTTIGVETSSSVLTDFGSPASVSGSVSGNVILGDDGQGADTVVDNTVVATVNGTSVEAGGTAIIGTYGTLTINPDGSYSYEVNNDLDAAAYGQVDSFEYTITAPGADPAQATLEITLDFTLPDTNITSADDFAFDEGQDVVSLALLDDGNDTITDFNLAEGDAVDLSGLIPEATPETISDFVEVTSDGGDTIIAVSPDADGSFEPVVTLVGVTHTLNELEDGLLGTSVI